MPNNIPMMGLLILVSAIQSRAQGPVFEVASVKPAAPVARGGARPAAGGDPARVVFTNTNLQNILSRAYRIPPYRIIGPSWLETERYDIVAKAPDHTPAEQIPLMLQALLAERFKLRTHRETRSLPVYALIVGKNGPKMQKAEAGGRSGMAFGDGIEAESASMVMLAQILSGYMDRPVLDLTELQGDYNFKLNVDVRELMRMKSGVPAQPAPDNASFSSIFTAVEEIGLKFEARKVPMEMLVIDGIEKVPTEN